MQSTKTNSSKTTHIGFFPLISLMLVAWVLYRSLFSFPVWFDETVGKAVFFGLPVWLYIVMNGNHSVPDAFAPYKLRNGLLLGIAVGGVFGFVTSIIALLQRGGGIESALLFSSDAFWREFALAIMTAFWETLLFFAFALTLIQEKFVKWSTLQQVLLSAAIFVLFHAPNTILQYDSQIVATQLVLLFLFAMGQGYLFAARRNAYALVLSHAIWGMVLLVHFW